MNNLRESIREACFDLAVSLMWERDNITIADIETNLAELQVITETFYNIAIFNLENIESLEGKPEILIRAIKYIENIHSIPPLRNNFEWFDYTLRAVIEIACPNNRLSRNNLEFLADIENGIADYRRNVLDEDI